MSNVMTTSPLLAPSAPHRRPSLLDEELSSSAQDILNHCPRFRILVLGKTGAGKSSIINAAFGVTDAHVSHSRAGESDIRQEIVSEQNPHFVLHDSKGFAAGETNNLHTVQEFIQEKAQPMVDIKDKLHAIWYCIEVPTENGALFEHADATFLDMNLQEVPVIIVFTKYDLLVRKLEKEAEVDEDMDDEEFERMINNQAEERFQRICVEPLRRTLGERKIPYIKVSTNKQYKDSSEMLAELTAVTKEHVDEAVWLIWAFAQRANASLKIDACVRVGQSKYWRGLASSLNFPGKSLKKCIKILHNEIVTVWNFHDPNMILQSDDFRKLMSQVVDELSDNPNHLKKLISVTGAVGVVGSVVPGGAIFALPVAAGLAFAQWVFLVYQETPGILRVLMAYIVDLTIVMQSLFWLMQARIESSNANSSTNHDRRAVDKRLVRLAYEAYVESGDRNRVHNQIIEFVKPTSVFKRKAKDITLEKVVDLINNNRFEPPDSFKRRAEETPILAEDGEEQWYFEEPEEMSNLGH